MLYTFFILLCGIYLGQEYPNIPSIKAIAANGTMYIRDNFVIEHKTTNQGNLFTKYLEIIYENIGWNKKKNE